MPDRKPYTFYLDADLASGLDQLKERDGIPVSEQIRRAIRAWLEEKSIVEAKTRPTSRKRS